MIRHMIQQLGLTTLLGVAGLFFYFALGGEISPKRSMDLSMPRSEAVRIAQDYLSLKGYEIEGMAYEVSYRYNATAQNFLSKYYGVAQANELIRQDTILSHRWQVYFYNPSVNTSAMTDQYRVWVSSYGTIVGFSHTIQDTAGMVKLSDKEAQQLAEQFLRSQNISLEKYRLETTSSVNQIKRRDHTFSFAANDSIYNGRMMISIRIQGNEVGSFSLTFETPQSYSQFLSENFSSFALISTVSYLVIFFLVLFIISLFLKKYHEGEVGVKNGVSIAMFLFAMVLISYGLDYEFLGYGVGLGDLNRTYVKLTMFVISVFILHVFLTAMTFAGWSVGESSARHGWSTKLSGIDSILQKRFFTRDVSLGLFHGLMLGFAILGSITILYWAVQQFAGHSASMISSGGIAEAYVPSVFVVTSAFVGGIMSEIVFRLFIISWVKEIFKKTWIGIAFSVMLWTLTGATLWDLPFGFLPALYHYGLFFVLGILFALIFLRFGLLASIVANTVVFTLCLYEPYLYTSSGIISTQNVLFALLCMIPMVFAGIGFIRREEFSFTPDTTPSHIKRISERERMAKELEIARSVQMSLLPKTNPQVAGYDIAGICIPAFEVGGDYYDFVFLGTNRIGIAIGDVSGKGVPAAIYMTLTKGVLQSHAEENLSPRNVLSKVNRLMYRTIERNSFVSMFYAIIDINEKFIRYARAGHNPVILVGLRGDQHEFLTPKGVALGLDEGKIFDSALEEREYHLHSGDLLVFYTDGFTEAHNEQEEEFGEQRLLNAVSSVNDRPAEKIIDHVVQEVKRFIGGAQQHDDMTMVVVKVR